MGRRSAAGAGAAAQAEASVTMGKEEVRRKRSAIYVKKTLVKPQSPVSKEDKPPSKLPPSPPLMSKARGARKSSPPKSALSPPRMRGGRVVSPSPMSKPRLNNHYTPPRYQSPPRSRIRGPSPPPPIGIRGRVARGLSPTRSSPSPPPYGMRGRMERPSSPPRISPSPVSTARIRLGRLASPSTQPLSPAPKIRSCGGRHASPSRQPPSPVPTSRARGGRHASPPRPPPSPVPRSRSRGGRAASPSRLPPSPPPGVRGGRAVATRRRSPSPGTHDLQLSPPHIRRNAGLGRRDAAIREITPCHIEEPIPSPIYQRLSPVGLNSNKRGRSPSPSPPPSYRQNNLSSKPPLPPQALSSRRPRSPTPVEERVLGPFPTKRSPSPVLKRRYSCVTVLPQDPIFSDLRPHLPPPPPTAPSNFRRITPNFAARRSRKASFVILNEATVKRKTESRRASVDGTGAEVDAEGKVKMAPRSKSVEDSTTKDAGGDGVDPKSKGESSGTKSSSGNGKNGRKKTVSIILLPDEDQPTAEGGSSGDKSTASGNGKKAPGKGEGKNGEQGKGEAKDGAASGDPSAAGATTAAVASSEVLAAAGGVAVTSPVPGAQTSAETAAATGETSVSGESPEGAAGAPGADPGATPAAPTAAATAAATVSAAPVTPGVVTAATQGDTQTGTAVQEEMVSKVVKGDADVESMGPNQMAPSGQPEALGGGGIRDQKQILEPGALGSSRGSIASTQASGIVSLQMGSGEEGMSGSIQGAPSDEAGSVEAFPGPGKDGSSKEGSIKRSWKSSLQPSKAPSKAPSAKSFKPVEYGIPGASGPKDPPTPRCPCCPSIALPTFLHPATRLCCPQTTPKSIVTGPNLNYIGKFAAPPSPVHTEKETGCTAKWYSCLEAAGCRSKKTGRWWWNAYCGSKKKAVAPVSVIGRPLALSSKPSWGRKQEEAPQERGSGLNRWLRRTICKSCMKPDEEKGMPKPPGKCNACCRAIFFCKCFEKCPCCKPDNAVADVAAIAAMESVAAKWNAVADTKVGKDGKMRGSMDPVSDKPKLDPTLVEHNSLIRAAIPILPVPLAWLCLFANTFAPGTGTLSSGIFCLCLGKPRFSIHDRPEGRLGSFCLNVLVAIFQVFTVIFCLVGWGWSLWWGVIMVRVARKHKKLRARAMEEGSSTNTASTSKDDNS